METIEIEAKKGKAYFTPEKFLSIQEASDHLSDYARRNNIKPNTINMINNIQNMDSYMDFFKNTRERFCVSSLQHVTTKVGAEQIVMSEGFKSSKGNLGKYTEGVFLSWWSAVAPEGDISSWSDGDNFSKSPALKEDASRYGNFRFSFPLSELICAYKEQYCGGGEPQLRVLGTKMFKYEISHVVLIHSPGTDQFDDLQPVLLSVQPEMYHVEYDSKSYDMRWAPESKFSGHKEEPQGLLYFVWNHLEVAFNVPEAGALSFPRQALLDHLSACEPGEPYLQSPDPKMTKAKADKILGSLKDKYTKEKPVMQMRVLAPISENRMEALEGEHRGKITKKMYYTGEPKKIKRSLSEEEPTGI
ncbi:uncharacterized protein LOC128654734 [Bombina bombina]|uniref:uncharacterized protein LOC128654734 n=1 Tax=Bombina bombina TaxID=8345 RepID=UPI00235A9CE2|nr:uncharacterized protein LOC128654734 [Bombina bombina]